MKRGGCLYQLLSLAAWNAMAFGGFSILIFFVNMPRTEPSLLIGGLFYFGIGFFGYRGLQSIETPAGGTANTPPPHDENRQHNSSNRNAEKQNPTHPTNEHPISEEERYAHTLGLSGMFTYEECRSAYRLKIAQYHPDKVAHLGNKLKEIAEQESKAINLAYKYFCDTHFTGGNGK